MELKIDNSKIYAVALEGGGAKGAYEIGVWKALSEAGIKYNAVSGTSVGSMCASGRSFFIFTSSNAFASSLKCCKLRNNYITPAARLQVR